MKKDLSQWGRKTKKGLKVEISAEGIEKALEAGKADYDKRQRDMEVCVFTHLIGGVLYGGKEQVPNNGVSINRLFEILSTQTYQNMFKSSMRNYCTDEVPSDFMRKLYDQYLAWRKQHESYLKRTTENRACNSLNDRPELGELDEKAWNFPKKK